MITLDTDAAIFVTRWWLIGDTLTIDTLLGTVTKVAIIAVPIEATKLGLASLVGLLANVGTQRARKARQMMTVVRETHNTGGSTPQCLSL